MAKVLCHVTMSPDGFIAGPGDGQPLVPLEWLQRNESHDVTNLWLRVPTTKE